MMVVVCVGRPVGTGVGDKSVTTAAVAHSAYLKPPSVSSVVNVVAASSVVSLSASSNEFMPDAMTVYVTSTAFLLNRACSTDVIVTVSTEMSPAATTPLTIAVSKAASSSLTSSSVMPSTRCTT